MSCSQYRKIQICEKRIEKHIGVRIEMAERREKGILTLTS